MIPSDVIPVIEKHAREFHPVILFNSATEKIASLDLSKSNRLFTEDIYNSTGHFTLYIEQLRNQTRAAYLVGGYREHREMYRRSKLFDKDLPGVENKVNEPRCIHLGTDIWGAAGTKIYAPLGGMVHSFAYNNHDGDYGATIILQHQLQSKNFYTLYGHLSLKDIEQLRKGQFISRGQVFAHFGSPEENGNWPPHLHFQLILDMGNFEGDYPGVCTLSEAAKYLQLNPDPDLVLKMNQFISAAGQ